MATWPIDLGYGTLTGRVLYMTADGPDEDREPDLTAAAGKVTVTPSVKQVRYTGTDGPILLASRTHDGILDSEGYICTVNADGAAGARGIVLPATDSPNLSPVDFTYAVDVRIGSEAFAKFNISVTADEVVDVAVVTPVASSGGTAVVVDTSTADRAEAAALRAETAAADAETGSEGPQGPQGEQGIQGEPGPQGDPGPAGADGVGGAPGAKGDTGETGAPGTPGTDGADGAQGIQGEPGPQGDPGVPGESLPPYDSGWLDVSGAFLNGWTGLLFARRIGKHVTFRYDGLNAAAATDGAFLAVPAGFSASAPMSRGPRPLLHTAANPPIIRRTYTTGGELAILGYATSDIIYGDSEWITDEPIPATLPGVAVPTA